MSLHDLIKNLVVRYRRRKLLRAYSRVFKIRTGKRVGFTPIMAALSYAEDDGLLTLEDGEVEWHWPESAGESDQ